MLTIFQYDFMIRAMIAGVMVAILCPFIGTFMVMRRYSNMADTLAHVSLFGVAIGLFLSINPLLGALGTSVLAGFLIERLRHSKRLEGDAILALILSGSLALALVLISLAHGLNADLFSYLFGSITTVTRFDLMLIGSLGILILGVGISFYKELFFITFDEELATADGLPTTFLNTLLIVLTALTVSVAMRIVGALLISALMVIPVLTAFQFKWSFQKTMGCAVGASLVAVVTGLIGSFYLDIAPGGSIVVVALGLFLLALGWNRGK